MDRKTLLCLQKASQHVPVYLQVSQLFEPQVQKNRHFYVLQPTFSFPLKTPLRLSRNMLHGWKDNSMLSKTLAACTYLTFFNLPRPAATATAATAATATA